MREVSQHAQKPSHASVPFAHPCTWAGGTVGGCRRGERWPLGRSSAALHGPVHAGGAPAGTPARAAWGKAHRRGVGLLPALLRRCRTRSTHGVSEFPGPSWGTADGKAEPLKRDRGPGTGATLGKWPHESLKPKSSSLWFDSRSTSASHPPLT